MNNHRLHTRSKTWLLFLLFSLSLYARIEHTGPGESEPLPIGNFALSTSQQPQPLVGFGQNILDKHDLVFYFFVDQFKGKGVNSVELMPYVLYGISDWLSIYASFPYLAKNRIEENCSVGIEDIFVQLEYAFFVKKNRTYALQTTLVGSVYAPTGSATKNPPTGFGSVSFFAGVTFSYQSIYWEVFTSQGVWFTTEHDTTKFGNQLWYQFGVERVIVTLPGWIFAGMLELDGYYLQRDTIAGQRDPNSGSNSLFLTPSLWISSKNLVVQLGAGVPVFQSFNGQQPSYSYTLAGNFGIKVPF